MRLLKVVWVFFPSMGYTQLWFRNTGLKQSSQICCFHSFLLDAFFTFFSVSNLTEPQRFPQAETAYLIFIPAVRGSLGHQLNIATGLNVCVGQIPVLCK